MIRRLSEFGMYVAIAGFKDARIGDVNRFFNMVRDELRGVEAVQFFDAKFIATWQHLYFAALNALTAFANEANICNNLAMETLLYASAQRQIQKATETMGLKPATTIVAVLVIAKTEKSTENVLKLIQKSISAQHDDNTLEIDPKKFDDIQRFFQISNKELSAKLERKGLEKEALVDLVIEHGALLATQR